MKRIVEKRLVPAATIERVEDAVPLAKALMDAGLDIIEVTFRTDAAYGAIKAITSEFPEMLVGAGTVLSEAQLDQAIDAGIKFAVAPGLNEDLVKKAQAAGIDFMPGVVTPTEIDRAIRLDCKVLKFFPAKAMGGPATLKALAGPYAHTGVKFLPTGGINTENAADYLALPVVAAVGGSWMVSGKLVDAGKWDEIAELSRIAVQTYGV